MRSSLTTGRCRNQGRAPSSGAEQAGHTNRQPGQLLWCVVTAPMGHDQFPREWAGKRFSRNIGEKNRGHNPHMDSASTAAPISSGSFLDQSSKAHQIQ